jgi:hypothetical protein
LLIILFFVAAAASIHGCYRTPGSEALPRCDALILAMVATGFWAAAGAEILSIGSHFRFWPALAWWTVPTLVLAVIAAGRRQRLGDWLSTPGSSDRTTLVLVSLAATILAVTGLEAIVCPTNTWDCWQYHLPRIFHWVQQGSVAHFAAHDRRQLEFPPMAEFLAAHWAILSGGYAWSNMHQWFAFLGAALAASITARELGAGARGQALAALLIVTNPAAATQATNGKNDVVVALWALALAYLGGRLWRTRRITRPWAAATGITLGLLVLTKGTGYFLAAPLCAAIGIAMLRIRGARAIPMGLAIGVLAIALNLPHWTRNIREFGSPLGIPQSRHGYPLANSVFTPAAVASTLVRDLALHAASPSGEMNTRVQAAVERFHDAIGISPSDPRTTLLPETQPFCVIDITWSDGNNPAPIHVLLALVLPVLALVRWRSTRVGLSWITFAVPYAAFLALVIGIRWQLWHIRLQIPFVSLFAPLIAVTLRRLLPAPRFAMWTIALTTTALTWNDLLWAHARPLIGEHGVLRETSDERLFQQSPETRAPLEAAAGAIANEHPRAVGLFMRTSSYEWPSLLLLHNELGPGVPLVNLNSNWAPTASAGGQDIDVVLAADPYPGPMTQWSTQRIFVPRASFPPFGVYLAAERARAELGHDDAPPFGGWELREGLRPEEGPYPATEATAKEPSHPALPVVRWALPPRTVLSFRSDGSPAVLLMDARRNGREDQRMTVRLNGEEIARYDFGPAFGFWPIRQELRPRAGENELVLEYRPEGPEFKGRGSVLFERLQVLQDP